MTPAADGGPVLDVVIVNWNAGDCLQACLRSLARYPPTVGRYGDICVVDNASTDGSVGAVSSAHVGIRLVCNLDNRGFGAACNQGARLGSGDLVLFLNPDAEVLPGTLDAAMGVFSRPDAADIGICGVHVITDDGAQDTSCARFPTLATVISRATGLTRVAPGQFPGQRLSAAETASSRRVDQVIGAFFLVRRELFEQLDGFDERFFLYFEEVDLAYRARQAGYGTWFLREASVRHRGAVSTNQVPDRRLFWSWRSRHQYAALHWPRHHAAALPWITLLLEAQARVVRAVVRGRLREAVGVAGVGRRYLRWVRTNSPAD